LLLQFVVHHLRGCALAARVGATGRPATATAAEMTITRDGEALLRSTPSWTASWTANSSISIADIAMMALDSNISLFVLSRKG